MMEFRHYLVFVLAVHVVPGSGHHGSHHHKPRHCTTVLEGEKTRFEIHMQSSSLPHGLRDFELDIPQPRTLCKPDHETGVEVTVCDLEHSPQIILKGFDIGIVHRVGSLNVNAPVHVTVFCRIKHAHTNAVTDPNGDQYRG